jgi:NAD-dependent SIR2 family protein deacetylase
MTEFIVACPKCRKDAVVATNSGYAPSQGKLTCSNCMFSESSEDIIRYKMIVKRNCDNCGKQINVEISNQKEPSKQVTICCPHCGITRTFEPRNEPCKLVYKSTGGVATDPVFNLPLWLQAEVKGNHFWAYNRRHLGDIKSYVQAKLRERQSEGYTTMVERLPQFIKEAKNREAILKTIEQLERR